MATNPPVQRSQPLTVNEWLTVKQRLRRPSTVGLTLTTDTNDAAPVGLSLAARVIVTDATGGHKITGLLAGSQGGEVTIEYAGNSVGILTLSARDPASSTANRFAFAHNVVLKPYQSISLRYGTDFANSGWFPTDDRFGTAAANDTGDFLASTIKAGILMQLGFDPGTTGSAILLPTQKNLLLPEDFTLTDWYAFAYPNATISLDARYHAAPTIPVSGDSITASHPITITASDHNTGTITGVWGTTALDAGKWLSLALTANDNATFIAVLFNGKKK